MLDRAWNAQATLRERGTAAMGLWQRVISDEKTNPASTEQHLRRIVVEFKNPECRPDIASGLRWVAVRLEDLLEKGMPVCNEWPEIDEPWFQRVQDAASEFSHADIPGHLKLS